MGMDPRVQHKITQSLQARAAFEPGLLRHLAKGTVTGIVEEAPGWWVVEGERGVGLAVTTSRRQAEQIAEVIRRH